MTAKRFKDRIFVFYFILFLVSTYLGVSQYFLVIFFFLCLFYALCFNTRIFTIFNRFHFSFSFIFIFYYILISLLNCLIGNIDFKDFANAIIKYILMPLSIIFLTPGTSNGRSHLFKALKSFLLLSLLYGIVETIIGFNFIDNILRIGNERRQDSHINNGGLYQPSSFFLHYSYYAFVLNILWAINWDCPCKKTTTNILLDLGIVFQILMCQSRINWFCFGFLLLFQYYTILKRKEFKKAKIIAIYFVILLVIVFILFGDKLIDFVVTRFGRIFEYGMQDGSVGQRVGTFLNFGDYISNNIGYGLFGSGFNGVEKYLLDYSYFPGYDTADSQFTVFLVDIGVVGTLIGVIAFIRLFLHNDSKYFVFKKMLLLIVLINFITLDLFSNGLLIMLVYQGCILSYVEGKRTIVLINKAQLLRKSFS